MLNREEPLTLAYLSDQSKLLFKRKINACQARAIQNIDRDTLDVERFKGAEVDPPYEPRKPTQAPQDIQDGLEVYHSGCHCGAITYAVETKPFAETAVISCNC